MNVVVQPSAEAVTEFAYGVVRDRMIRKGYRVLGLPTGGTPLLLYSALAEGYQRGELDFSEVVTFNLDEYIGLEPHHPRSFRNFMQVNFFDRVNIRPENIHFLSGLPDDVETHCEEYEADIVRAGGIRLQILGIGRNGHIGFNEPVSALRSRTRDKTLSRETIEDNRQYFDNEDDVPRWALTMGVGTILDAREILLLATGAQKADAIAAMVEGPLTAMCTASALQLHPRMTLVCDEAAAAGLRCREHYRWMFENDYRMYEIIRKGRGGTDA